MLEETIFITREGYNKLKSEYGDLVGSKRRELVRKIREAREQGDLSENAAYKSAKDEQSLIESRISELEEILKRAKVIEPKKKHERVEIGCRVKVALEEKDQEFQIVGDLEANPSQNRISYRSPLGKALLGKRVNERVEVETSVGTLIYVIKEIC